MGLLSVAPAAGEFRAAIAVQRVTPETLLPVSGGVGPSDPTTRKMGELTVRALVLERDDTRVAICSTDFLGFPGVLCEKVRTQVSHVPASNIVIGATHTHSAPDCYGFPDESGNTSCDLAYLDSVCSALAQAIDTAAAGLQPAAVKIATGIARGRIAYNYYAEKLYDPRCHVLQVVGRDRKPIATLVNYACQPEVLGSDQGILSPIRPSVRPDRGEGRRHGNLHELRTRRHGHRRLPRARRQRHADVGRVHPDRPSAGR